MMIAQVDASRFGWESSRRFFIVESLKPPIYGSVFAWDVISSRHSGKANVLFADGHVGSETPWQLLYPSLENWTRWNYDNRPHWGELVEF